MSLGIVASAYVAPAGGGAWSPLDLDLVGWWDASDTATITASSGAVSQWNDKSGNGLHVAVVNGTAPQTGTLTRNSLNVLDFKGSPEGENDELMVDAGSDAIDINPFTVYVAWRYHLHSNEWKGVISSRTTTGGADNQAFQCMLIRGGWRGTAEPHCDGQAPTTQGAEDGNWRLTHTSFNGTTAALRHNGSTATTVTWTNPPNLVRYLRFGNRCVGGTPPATAGGGNTLQFGEIIIAHDSADTAAYTYLADKWALTVTIP